MKHRTFQTLAEWYLRVGLATAFLAAVADRFGIWGAPGSPGIAWGDWAHFRAYADSLNALLPAAIRPVLAGLATIAEVALGLGLLVLHRSRWVALSAGVLLTLFALAMTFALGPKAPLNYSVWTAAGGAFLLASVARK